MIGQIFLIDSRCCLLHDSSKGDPSEGKILLFTSARLEQCTSIRKIRKDKGLKYGNVELPETFDSLSMVTILNVIVVLWH